MMQWMTGLSCVVAVVCLSSFLAGCASPVTYGVSDGGSSWSIASEDPTPGIDEGSVSLITLRAGPPTGVPLAVWSDLPNGRFGSGTGQKGKASYDGGHRASDGRAIKFQAVTTDGVTGTVTIEDQDYDLADGSLFLVSKQADSLLVAQLKFDVGKLTADRERLMELARSNEKIRNFFEQRKPSGTPPAMDE